MDYIRRANERGQADFGWLNSRHSFSFGNYYDPRHMGLSVLRVINDDVVSPGAGFDTHGHRDMEIISYILEGSIEHQDSMGHKHRIDAGEVQRMSAGSGVMHSEYNASNDASLRFLQIWITPNQHGIEPGYEQKTIAQQGKLTELVTPDGRNGTLMMHQDAVISRIQLEPGEQMMLDNQGRSGYLHIISGTVEASSPEQSTITEQAINLAAADAVGLIDSQTLQLSVPNQQAEPLTALWFDLPAGRSNP